jgi:hypothetical protein
LRQLLSPVKSARLQGGKMKGHSKLAEWLRWALTYLTVALAASLTTACGLISHTSGQAEHSLARVSASASRPVVPITPDDVSWFFKNQVPLSAPTQDMNGTVGVSGGKLYVPGGTGTEAAQATANDLSQVLGLLDSLPTQGLRQQWVPVVKGWQAAAVAAINASRAPDSSAAARAFLQWNSRYVVLFNQLANAAKASQG